MAGCAAFGARKSNINEAYVGKRVCQKVFSLSGPKFPQFSPLLAISPGFRAIALIYMCFVCRRGATGWVLGAILAGAGENIFMIS